MTIPALPALDRTSPTFKTDVDTFFATQLPSFAAALDPEIERLNAVGYGSYNASSTTSLTIGTGSKSLTIETGKGYVAGQAVLIASTAGPTNFMTGQVTSYNSGTGALVVSVTATGGSGTVAAWTISVTALAGGGVSPDSIVVLTSGTSWTCPAGVTKARLRAVGGGSGVGIGAAQTDIAPASGAYIEQLLTLVPGTAYAYVIGAGGTVSGGSGGDTTFAAGGITYTAQGSRANYSSDPYTSNAQVTLLSFRSYGSPAHSPLGRGGRKAALVTPGYGGGNYVESPSTAAFGGDGAIILELYK